jgi:tight adherence protein B
MEFRKLASLLQAGIDLKTALAELGHKSVPAELRLATELGAPLKTLLISLADQHESSQRAKAELAQALAMPRMTRRLLLWLPGLTLALTLLTGITTIQSLANPLVLFSLLLGTALLLIGNRISRKMLSEVDDSFSISELQLFSIAISAGLTTGQISKLFPNLLKNTAIESLVNLTGRTGAGLQQLVNSEIENTLRLQLSEKITLLRELSVRLLIPLGLTTLPAFMLFTIPPTMVGLAK